MYVRMYVCMYVYKHAYTYLLGHKRMGIFNNQTFSNFQFWMLNTHTLIS